MGSHVPLLWMNDNRPWMYNSKIWKKIFQWVSVNQKRDFVQQLSKPISISYEFWIDHVICNINLQPLLVINNSWKSVFAPVASSFLFDNWKRRYLRTNLQPGLTTSVWGNEHCRSHLIESTTSTSTWRTPSRASRFVPASSSVWVLPYAEPAAESFTQEHMSIDASGAAGTLQRTRWPWHLLKSMNATWAMTNAIGGPTDRNTHRRASSPQSVSMPQLVSTITGRLQTSHLNPFHWSFDSDDYPGLNNSFGEQISVTK